VSVTRAYCFGSNQHGGANMFVVQVGFIGKIKGDVFVNVDHVFHFYPPTETQGQKDTEVLVAHC